MDYFYPLAVVGITGFVTYNFLHIVNYAIKAMLYSPGEGEIYKKFNPYLKTNNYFIKSPDRNFRLNYVKTPCFDVDVGFFVKNIKYDDVFMDNDVFEEKFSGEKIYNLHSYGMGVIEDVYHTKNIKRGNLYGFIKMLTEEEVYLFEIEEGPIDLVKVFEQYEEDLYIDVD